MYQNCYLARQGARAYTTGELGRRPGMVSSQSNPSTSYIALSEGVWRGSTAVHEASAAGPPKPRLLDRVRAALRIRHYSSRTEEAYVASIRHDMLFHA